MEEVCEKNTQVSTKHGQPGVLVGIVTHNREEILPKAVRSALLQCGAVVRVAVLDDGSETFSSDLQDGFPEVQWHHWHPVRGILEARNRLMRTTDAEYYVSLDDDAWFLLGDEISVAIDYMETNRRVAAVAFDILSPDHPQPVRRFEPHPTSAFIGCGHVVRLSAVRECGYYASTPGQYGSEEKDLCLRLLDRHWDIHLLPGVHVWHDKTAVARDQQSQHSSGVCNDLVLAVRRCPFPLVLDVVPAKVFKHLRFALKHSLVKACLAGIDLFLRNALTSWRSREPVRTKTFIEFARRSRQTS